MAIVPTCFLAMALFTRHPFRTNYIFDEQEALLANPYVRSVAEAGSKLRWIDAFYRDFWGLTPDRTIGSYRPLPDLVWRALWWLGARQNPFLHHWVNVLAHGVNGGLVALLAARLTRDKRVAWMAGVTFVTSALLTEAVSGVVGIADVLGGTGALLALLALTTRLPVMVPALLGATLFGLYAKESALCIVALVPLAAVAWAHVLHPETPRRWLRGALAAVACTVAFVFYVEARRRMFPARIDPALAVEQVAGKPLPVRVFAALLRWYAQPQLPHDPLNNPLILGTGPERVAGALRVYLRGLCQVLVPLRLSGDYSAPQEPIPTRLVTIESGLGAILLVLPLIVGPVLAWRAWRHPANAPPPEGPRLDGRPMVAVALMWIVLSYFPVSNIPIVLPTVRAERFWYFPVIGTSMLLGLGMVRALDAVRVRCRRSGTLPWAPGAAMALVVVFFAWQCVAARRHANDYVDDVTFWDATRKAVPRSAKAHLNYSVMIGARGDLEGRLAANAVAMDLAPQWAMAHVYYGDTLCRLHRVDEAWPHLKRGFELSPGDANLVALGLQCLWDEHALEPDDLRRDEVDELAQAHPGSWLEFLARDILGHGEEHQGVNPKYRPRGYNEGPKGE